MELMKMKSAFLIAGVKSGSGKTLITLSIMAALRNRGLAVQPFKCGPDYIDPTLHYLVTGKISSNLDIRMCGEKFCRDTFAAKAFGTDIAVVEGVMGLFDGGEGSSANLAKTLGLPVILVVDVRSAAESMAAVLHGFENYDKALGIAGVIFNFTGSDRHRALIENEVKKRCNTPVLGFIPRNEQLKVPSRHLGLHMGDELQQELNLNKMAELLESHVDIDKLIQLCRYKRSPVQTDKSKLNAADKPYVRLAVARDEAFCFYYQDNLDLLKEAGIEISYFSPVHDAVLPKDIQGIYLGGGYPEIYAKQLSGNVRMTEEIKTFCLDGGIIYAECGGFMYLCKSIADAKGKVYSMAGLFNTCIRMDKKLRKLGYREVRLHRDCFLGKKGKICFGHEFHYSEEENTSQSPPLFTDEAAAYGRVDGNCLGSYVHLHFGRTPEICENMYSALLKRKTRVLHG